jgi:transcriptional regulator GlxA family with amidase domain
MLYPSIEMMRDIAEEFWYSRGTPYFPNEVLSRPTLAQTLVVAHWAAERGDRLVASMLVRTAFGELLRRHAQPWPARTPRHASSGAVQLAREILHERLIDPPSLEQLAEAVGTRPLPLLRAFKRATGLPPHAYLNQARIQRARSLLDGGRRPADVAAEVGFTDQSHLTRQFKRIVGVAPGAYAQTVAGGSDRR